MSEIFRFTVSPWELIVRGSSIYWLLFLLFRFVLRRNTGSVGLADILLVVLIADAAQNGMAGEYKSVGDGVILIATIAGWNYLLDWLAFRFAWFRRFMEPNLMPLVRDGQPIQSNLARQFLTLEELESKLRQKGIEAISDVKYAALEADGQISVVSYSSQKGRLE